MGHAEVGWGTIHIQHFTSDSNSKISKFHKWIQGDAYE